MWTVRELRDAVTGWAQGFDPATVDAATAARLVTDWAAIEHAAATVKALAAHRVAGTSAWKPSGAPSAADWLARTTGTTAAHARDTLATAAQLAQLDEVAHAARAGQVSPAQTAAIAAAATVDPHAETGLLTAAQHESLGELRQRCARTRAAADPDPEATRARIHAHRRLRRWTGPDGTGHLHAEGPSDLLARLDTELAARTDRLFATARSQGRREDPEAYAFDALIDLADSASPTATGTGTDTGTAVQRQRTRYRAIVRVDLDALLRGSLDGDQTCEIAGLGPIPVAIARQLLGESTLHLVLTRGTDVANVTYLGRGPNAAQRIALLWQAPGCTRLGCPRHAHLQIDHRTPWNQQPVTQLANLDPLCHHDHQLKTHHGWALTDGTGKRPLVPPDHPDHPNRARAPANAAVRSA